MQGHLTETQMNNLLSSQIVGRIAFVEGDQPHILPVNYSYDGKYIYGQTNPGTKLNILKKSPKVCFEVDAMLDLNSWQSVIVYGDFEELQGKHADTAREILFGKIYTLESHCRVHSHEHEVMAKIDESNRVKSILYRIRIERMSGKFENLL